MAQEQEQLNALAALVAQQEAEGITLGDNPPGFLTETLPNFVTKTVPDFFSEIFKIDPNRPPRPTNARSVFGDTQSRAIDPATQPNQDEIRRAVLAIKANAFTAADTNVGLPIRGLGALGERLQQTGNTEIDRLVGTGLKNTFGRLATTPILEGLKEETRAITEAAGIGPLGTLPGVLLGAKGLGRLVREVRGPGPVQVFPPTKPGVLGSGELPGELKLLSSTISGTKGQIQVSESIPVIYGPRQTSLDNGLSQFGTIRPLNRIQPTKPIVAKAPNSSLSVTFDPINGLGASDITRNIKNVGFVGFMDTSQVLAFSGRGSLGGVDVTPSLISRGLQVEMSKGRSIAPPTLTLAWDTKNRQWTVEDHEGLDRVLAFRARFYASLFDIPVYIRTLGYPGGPELLASELTPSMVRGAFMAHDADGARFFNNPKRTHTFLHGRRIESNTISKGMFKSIDQRELPLEGLINSARAQSGLLVEDAEAAIEAFAASQAQFHQAGRTSVLAIHGTNAENLPHNVADFRFGGFHAGTEQAAAQRMVVKNFNESDPKPPNFIPVRIELNRTIGTVDNPASEAFVAKLSQDGVAAGFTGLGFDGVIYLNDVEDPGSLSVVVLNGGQGIFTYRVPTPMNPSLRRKLTRPKGK